MVLMSKIIFGTILIVKMRYGIVRKGNCFFQKKIIMEKILQSI